MVPTDCSICLNNIFLKKRSFAWIVMVFLRSIPLICWSQLEKLVKIIVSIISTKTHGVKKTRSKFQVIKPLADRIIAKKPTFLGTFKFTRTSVKIWGRKWKYHHLVFFKQVILDNIMPYLEAYLGPYQTYEAKYSKMDD